MSDQTERRDPQDTFAMKALRACVKRGEELNALGKKASYEKVSSARGLYELSAHQVALFAPHILKMLRRRKHAD